MPPSGAAVPPPGLAGRGAWPLALLAGLAVTPAAAAPLLLPEPLPGDEYTETFTFVADLDDGTYVQLQLAVTNLGPGAGTGLCRALVKRPGAAPWTRSARTAPGAWRHQAGPGGEALSVGPCAARSGEGSSVLVALGGREVELTFPEPAAARAPPTTILAAGREYHAAVLQAFTPVSARLAGFDLPDRLDGGGYADHSRSNVAVGTLAHRWLRFRALRPPHRLLVLARQALDGTWGPAWIWREGAPPHPLDAVELQAGGAGWTAALHEGPARGAVTSGPRLQRHAPLEELGLVGRLVGAVMTVPVTYTYRGTLAAPDPVDGILEISVLGEE